MPYDCADFPNPHEGKKLPSISPSSQAPSNGFDPRRLLDPKGFEKYSRLEGEAKQSIDFPSIPSQRYADGYVHPEMDVSAMKRDHDDDYEGHGMGSLIEKAYNVGYREERPQKKQKLDKTEEFEDVQEKPNFSTGGGKGGELGGYVKQKKQEGLRESGSVSTSVVDLTQGGHLTVKDYGQG